MEGNMLLSEAIRKGCKAFPKPCYNEFFSYTTDAHRKLTGIIGCCALGAALAGCLGNDISYISKVMGGHEMLNLNIRFPYLSTKGDQLDIPDEFLAAVPAFKEDHQHLTLGAIIVEMNDAARWSRERIADWVESQEKKLGVTDADSTR